MLRVGSHADCGASELSGEEGEGIAEDGQLVTIGLTYGTGNEWDPEVPYVLTKDEKPYGTLSITWKKTENVSDVSLDVVEKRWLFKKLTRLSVELYPGNADVSDSAKLPELEDVATIQVTDAAEVVRHFSTKKAGTSK